VDTGTDPVTRRQLYLKSGSVHTDDLARTGPLAA
jgi:hypothetical protein